ncbi:MAG: CDP-alcohol phosphatidyltransferase family protein [Oscillospiraceae bacterium]|nr:CDP-alcohol phosphatidyltransferase family protein [Oscillospiraceae bacterium]
MRSDRHSASGIIRYIRKEILTIPNILSLFRILIIPHIISLYFNSEYGTASIWILISFASDVADGFIARHFDMVSSVGKVLDPIADKLTQGMIFICLISRYRWLGWFTCFFAFKELTVFYIGFISYMYTKELDQARWYGKMCTGVVIASLLIMVLFPSLPESVIKILSGLCIAVLLFSLYMYTRHYQQRIEARISSIPGDHYANMFGIAFSWLVTFALGAAMIAGRHILTGDAVASFISDNAVYISAAVLLLFLLKAAGMPFYIGVIYIVCGFLYGTPLGIGVCVIGGAIVSCIQYFRGRNRFAEYKEELSRRLTCIDAYNSIRSRCAVFFMFLTRFMCLPTELVSIYMGVTGLRFRTFIAGSLLGKLPDMILFTIMGSHLTDIGSAAFIISAAVKVLGSSALCLFLYLNGKKLAAVQDSGTDSEPDTAV